MLSIEKLTEETQKKAKGQKLFEYLQTRPKDAEVTISKVDVAQEKVIETKKDKIANHLENEDLKNMVIVSAFQYNTYLFVGEGIC